MFFKIGALKTCAIFTGKHLCCSLFLIKLQSSGLQLYCKKTSIQVFSIEYCRILKNSFFNKTSLVAVSETGRKSLDHNKLIMNNYLRYEQQQRTKPIAVTKELDGKNKNSNIICNLWLLLFPTQISQGF